mmetsp:Transcript_41306/g.78983  ORF Transcript_41306/g.78983 Transcript_41306/m.78983 type:complete len:429 (+) Transcript_41306:99-1385(+)
MRFAAAFLIVFVVASVTLTAQAWFEDKSLRDLAHLEEAAARIVFGKFVDHHERSYAQDLKEAEDRFQVFWENMKFVAAHNQKGASFEVELNHLADLRAEEALAQRMGLRATAAARPLPGPKEEIKARFDPFPRATPGHSECAFRLRDVRPPRAVDWREVGVVAPVKDQMSCGSCWAYATTSATESVLAIDSGKMVELSEQFLTDCNWMSNKCVGGNMEEGYKWMTGAGYVTLEDYPYAAQKAYNKCNMSWYNAPSRGTIDTYEMIPEGEENLKKAVAIQPVSVGLDANHKEFLFYKGGIFDHQPCNDTEELLTHAITAVGYGEEQGVGYWILRNQWSTGWGEDGYVRMAMGKGPAGLCGIARIPSRPVMDGSVDFHLYSHLPEWALQARRQVVKNEKVWESADNKNSVLGITSDPKSSTANRSRKALV